ncbi:MAG: helix-turn-helix transcriptional regulator [Alicyclobacillus sp.]|nr:helix-turn-helix transcriptional regulator [Alicyclobacillus sp.]
MGSLAERVKYYRVKKNLSVRDLARLAGVSVSYVYAIEAGLRGHNIVKLERIAMALGVPLTELWSGEST